MEQSYADLAKELIKKYKRRVDRGDSIAIKSLNRELEYLAKKQEAQKAEQDAMIQASNPQIPQQVPQEQMQQEMPQQSMGQQMMRYGGGMRRQMVRGGDTENINPQPTTTNGKYYLKYYGNTIDSPDRNSRAAIDKEISKEDYDYITKANKKHDAYQKRLQAASNGKDLSATEVRKILGKDYDDWNNLDTTLREKARKYEIPVQTFGLTENKTKGINYEDFQKEQYAGPRVLGTDFNTSFEEVKAAQDAVNKGTATPEDKATLQQYERVKNEYDPYKINDKYDIASTIAATAPLARHEFKEDQLKFDRVAPGYVSYENERQQTRRDADIARNVGLNNLRNTASGSGQAAANALALQTGLQSNLDRGLASSQEREANTNSGIFGQNQAQNAQISQAEKMQNYADRRYVDEGNFNTSAQIGRNIAGLTDRIKDNRNYETWLANRNPDYYVNKEGEQTARYTWKPVDNNVYGQAPIDAPAPVVNEKLYNDPELTAPLQPIDNQPLWKQYIRRGGRLTKKY
jgi:hypothetical protein